MPERTQRGQPNGGKDGSPRWGKAQAGGPREQDTKHPSSSEMGREDTSQHKRCLLRPVGGVEGLYAEMERDPVCT